MAMILKKVKEFFVGKKEIKTTPAELKQKLDEIAKMVNDSASIEDIKAKVDDFVSLLDALDKQVDENMQDVSGRGWLSQEAASMDLARLQKGKNSIKRFREQLAETVKPVGIEVKLPNPNENQSEVEFGS